MTPRYSCDRQGEEEEEELILNNKVFHVLQGKHHQAKSSSCPMTVTSTVLGKTAGNTLVLVLRLDLLSLVLWRSRSGLTMPLSRHNAAVQA